MHTGDSKTLGFLCVCVCLRSAYMQTSPHTCISRLKGGRETLRSTHTNTHTCNEWMCLKRYGHTLQQKSAVFLPRRHTFSSSSCLSLWQEIVDKDGQSKVLSFTVPSLSKPSVYHEVRKTNGFTFSFAPVKMFHIKNGLHLRTLSPQQSAPSPSLKGL